MTLIPMKPPIVTDLQKIGVKVVFEPVFFIEAVPEDLLKRRVWPIGWYAERPDGSLYPVCNWRGGPPREVVEIRDTFEISRIFC